MVPTTGRLLRSLACRIIERRLSIVKQGKLVLALELVPVVGAVEDQGVGGPLAGEHAVEPALAGVAAGAGQALVPQLGLAPVRAQVGLEPAPVAVVVARAFARGDAVAEGDVAVRPVRARWGAIAGTKTGRPAAWGTRDRRAVPGEEVRRQASAARAVWRARGHARHGERAARGRLPRAAAHVHRDSGQAHVFAAVEDTVAVLVVEDDARDRAPRTAVGVGLGPGPRASRRRRSRERGSAQARKQGRARRRVRTHETNRLSRPSSLVAPGSRLLYCELPSTDHPRTLMSSSAGAPRTNRRLTARKACLLTVRYRTAKDWHPATCMDLSRDGCRLRLGEDLARGSAVTLLFEAPLADGARSPSVEVSGQRDLGPARGPVLPGRACTSPPTPTRRRHRQRHLLSPLSPAQRSQRSSQPSTSPYQCFEFAPSGSSGSRRGSRRAARARLWR